jgi:K+-sensing histidine kinase KdpD
MSSRESSLDWRYDPFMKHWLGSLLGTALCVAAAGCLIPLFHASSFRIFLPLLFLGIVVVVAIRFGNMVGVVGTIAATLIFAAFLFELKLSLAVNDMAARMNLIWMLIVGLIVSELVGYHPKGGKQ